jgi:hypothetical protein
MEKTKRGIDSLLEAIKKDCSEGNNCFNPNGCDKERHLYLPQDNPGLLEMGIKTKCVVNTKCMHDYCGKFKWIMDRAEMYAKLTDKTKEEVIEAWEEQRTYWYMNFYQEANQPEIKTEGMNVVLYDNWIKSLKEKFGEDAKNWKFKCPNCEGIQSAQDFIDSGAKESADNVYYNCIGRYVEGKGCDWTLGGLFKIHKTIVVKDMKIIPVFEIAE